MYGRVVLDVDRASRGNSRQLSTCYRYQSPDKQVQMSQYLSRNAQLFLYLVIIIINTLSN